MKATIFDYGAGNLHSLAKAIDLTGIEVCIEADPVVAVNTDVLILPGVGAFPAAAERLAPGLTQMRNELRAGLPCLGICLGMQLLLDESEEGPGEGLGVIPGRVRKLNATRVPQIGWNSVNPLGSGVVVGSVREPTLRDVSMPPVASTPPIVHLPPIAYFANGYVCAPNNDSVIQAWTEHETDKFPSVIKFANTIGVQFHPEKSSATGVQFIKEFIQNARNTSR